ncbi:hypothetical protein EML15_08075 [Corynebacterium sp. sy017]|uniref:winged helix DNA-binding domain-containing protein n=1 Tax=unclassified Corynebacterium TaxID=2624378 RepID=UPI001186F5DF|nr:MULTISPECIES: winged helix DNA-binding domain-containing protein [unclassified Corynebacterium]MBP3089100.1 hypothetical protein [Corynebacterium sp. sy017]TSD91414.1 hypothetical protein ELY17_08085 [Corynebacterium sp. SY003]
MAGIVRVLSHDNELKWCFQSQVYDHAFLAARMHLSDDDWNKWIELSQEEQLVRAPLLRGTLHTLPRQLYSEMAHIIRPVIERIIKSHQVKRYGTERIEEVWHSTTALVDHEGKVKIDNALHSLSTDFPEIRKSDLKYLIRSAPEIVEIANGDQLIERIPLKPGIVDHQNLFSWYIQCFSSSKKDFLKWSGFLNREVKDYLSEKHLDHLPQCSTPFLHSEPNELIVLPPFDPFLLAYSKEQRLRHIDTDHYNQIWGKTGIVNGAIVRNNTIIGQINFKGKNVCKVNTWESLENSEIEQLKDALQFMRYDLQQKVVLEISYTS